MLSQLVQDVQHLYTEGRNAQVIAALQPGWEGGHTGADLAMLHYYRGSAAWKLEDYLTAGTHFAAAYQLIGYVENTEDACWIALAYGLRQGRMGDATDGADLIAKAYVEYAPAGQQRGYMLWGWGWNACQAGDIENGLDLIRRAVGSFVNIGSELDVLCVTVDLAECYARAGKCAEALAELQAMESRVEQFGLRWQALYANVRAEVAAGLSDQLDAAYWTLSALEMASKAGSDEQMSRAKTNHMRIAALLGLSVTEVAEQAYDACVCARNGARLQLVRSWCEKEGLPK